MVGIMRRSSKSTRWTPVDHTLGDDDIERSFVRRASDSVSESSSTSKSLFALDAWETNRGSSIIVELQPSSDKSKSTSKSKKKTTKRTKSSSIVSANLQPEVEEIPTHSMLRQLAVGNLVRLNLCGRALKLSDVRTLARALSLTSVCKVVELRNCGLECPHVQAFARFSKCNRSLAVLDLSFNYISDTGVIALAQNLKQDKSLRRLELSNNDITEHGLKRLTRALEENRTLTNINMAENDIENTNSFRYLDEIIQRNRSSLVKSYVVSSFKFHLPLQRLMSRRG